MTAVLACLALGAAVAGCAHSAAAEKPSASEEPSARQMLDAANDTMKALRSVTVDADIIETNGEDRSTRLRTDLKGRCASKTTWATGRSLEEMRIGKTDYVRANQGRWRTAPAREAKPEDGIDGCGWEFATFGVAKKRKPTEVNGSPARRLVVTDKADEGGTYTFYIATEGKPYILKVVYEGAVYHSVTTFSAFDEPLDVRPPAKADPLDASDYGPGSGV
ncbi:hypothetical protein ACFZCY_24380 [Streptomyces sp. NPDC007983]|uniref:hypothetical protein n=1 Tax=Streptomyces sp. NPDC007983 TaxID=3364800 RepID=UPI0036EEC2D2